MKVVEMKIVEMQIPLIALSYEELELIIEGLQNSYYGWNDKEAGMLLSQFNKVKSSLGSIGN